MLMVATQIILNGRGPLKMYTNKHINENKKLGLIAENHWSVFKNNLVQHPQATPIYISLHDFIEIA